MFTGFYFRTRLRACFFFLFFCCFFFCRVGLQSVIVICICDEVFLKEREEQSLLYFFSGVYLLILQFFVTLGSHFLRLNKPKPRLRNLWHAPSVLLRVFATVKTKWKLGRVNFRKDFWDCFQGKENNQPIADRCVPSTHPRNTCGTHFGSSCLPVSKVVNCFTIQVDYQQSPIFPQGQ